MELVSAAAQIVLDTDTHVYTVDGVRCPNVTTILSRVGLADYSMIPEAIRDYCLERGSAVHKAAHYVLEGDLDESSVDPAIAGYLKALDNFLHHSDFVPELTEYKIHDPVNWYCGTLDVIGVFPSVGRTICDWKLGMMPAVRWQLAAYSRALPNPAYNRAAIKLNKDATYRVKMFPPSTFKRDCDDFLAINRVYKLLEAA